MLSKLEWLIMHLQWDLIATKCESKYQNMEIGCQWPNLMSWSHVGRVLMGLFFTGFCMLCSGSSYQGWKPVLGVGLVFVCGLWWVAFQCHRSGNGLISHVPLDVLQTLGLGESWSKFLTWYSLFYVIDAPWDNKTLLTLDCSLISCSYVEGALPWLRRTGMERAFSSSPSSDDTSEALLWKSGCLVLMYANSIATKFSTCVDECNQTI